MKPIIKLVPPIVAAFILLTSALSSGTTLLAMDLESLTQSSDEICTGRVIDRVSFLKEGRIYTLNRVRVESSIKGKQLKGAIIEVVTAGGHSELFSQKVFGAAELQEDASYLLFLEKRGAPDVVHPVGMSQGALPIKVEPNTKALSVHPPRAVPRLLSRDPVDGRFRPATPWLTKTRQLDEVVTEIRSFIGGIR